MKEKKFSLEIVNNGEPFDMPKWTVAKHRAALVQMNEDCKDMSDDEKNEEFNYYVVYQTLKEIDKNVSLEDIKNLHPEDMIQLFAEVYNAGKTGIYFREGKKPTTKSTGTKK